jgi:two-component system, NtrC family, sensor kinase
MGSIKMFNRSSIREKISFGYAIAIGIAILGTSIGQIIGYYKENAAWEQLKAAHQEEYALDHLKSNILEIEQQKETLIYKVNDLKDLKEEQEKMFKSLKDIEESYLLLKKYMNEEGKYDKDIQDLVQWAQEFYPILEEYKQQLKILFTQINLKDLSPENNGKNIEIMVKFYRSETAKKILVINEELAELIEESHQEGEKAQNEVEAAKKLHNQIIYTSLILSILIATILVLYTSKIIAQPIEKLTKIAKKITAEANFNLQVPVSTQDEIGTLAKAFNQLIIKVKEYTEQLAEYNQNLENRVEERTAEVTKTLQELQQTQSQLIQSEKMSSLGQMVAGIAHEINNPVNFIYGNAEHINQYFNDLLNLIELYQKHHPNSSNEISDKIEEIDLEFLKEDLEKILHSIKIGSTRIRELVLSLRNFSRLDEAEKKAVNIHEGIDNTLLLLNHRLKKDEIQIIKNYGRLPEIDCYPAQLNQVFMNIISNGIDALEDQENPNKKQIIITTKVTDKNHVIIKISDNGKGIPPEIKARIFDPFFTTKTVGKGTGLGLSISYQIIKKHQGDIEVTSSEQTGTEFEIFLPIVTT